MINEETTAAYSLDSEQGVINKALTILESRICQGDAFKSPGDIKNYLKLRFSDNQADGVEMFGMLALTNQHHLIKFVELVKGTINGASVYSREVVKTVLKLNCAAVVLVHNHPSDNVIASTADKAITAKLKSALALIDVHVIDHFIVSNKDVNSAAEQGWL